MLYTKQLIYNFSRCKDFKYFGAKMLLNQKKYNLKKKLTKENKIHLFQKQLPNKFPKFCF